MRPPVTARSSPPPDAGLPFRLRIDPVAADAPVVAGMSVRLAQPCLTREGEIVVHPDGEPLGKEHRLRIRLDGHTSRPLVVGRRRPTSVTLDSLLGEWDHLEGGQHEVLVFVGHRDGGVPELPDGRLALLTCRFSVEATGLAVQEPTGDPIALLVPEGTLNGPRGDASLQISGPRAATVALRLTLPDGEHETHVLSPGRFTVFPLLGGDYGFVIANDHLPVSDAQAPNDPPHSTDIAERRDELGAGSLGYEQWVTVNPEPTE